jgi:hypothetical protein
MASKIEQELLKVTGQKAIKRGEDVQDYQKRLITAVDALDEETWNGLSNETQSWYNSGVKAVKDKEPIPAFPDNEVAPEEKKADGEQGDAGKPEEKAAEGKPAAAPKAKAKAPAQPKPAAEKQPGDHKRGGSDEYIKLLIKNPTWNKEALLKATNDAGFKLSPSTADILYYDAKKTINVLVSLGGKMPA